MKFGTYVYQRRPQDLAANAKLAEQLGFESVWQAEHVALPVVLKSVYPHDPEGPPINADTRIHDPLIAFGYLAAITTKIRFGTGVYILPLRNPFMVAKAVATLDQLSNGRFIFGVGIGWLKEEFEYVGMNWADRAARNNEYLTLMTALWNQTDPVFRGKTVRAEGFRFWPKTIQQPHPPFIIGGNTPAAFRRAAKYGDGWFGPASTIEHAREMIDSLRQTEGAYPRQRPLEITMGTAQIPTADDVGRLADLGVERVVIRPASRDSLDVLRRFHEQVMTKV
jgi:probable F420-dependent oxidoreductase